LKLTSSTSRNNVDADTFDKQKQNANDKNLSENYCNSGNKYAVKV